MKRVFLLRNAFLILLLVSGFAMAAVISPVTQLSQIAGQMINELEKNKAQLKTPAATGIINNIVDKVLVPNVDMDKMGGAVLGRQYWISASSAQKQDFLSQFKLLLVSTYASALSSYNGDKVQFYPLSGDYREQSTTLVKSVILRKNGQRIAINYDVARVGSGWKVYDFSIENVSMVQSYRSQFASILANGGMDALLQRLHQHNSQRQ